MMRGLRWLIGEAGVVLAAFGLGCLNYTKADGLEHHTAVARRHGLPEPSNHILYLGAACLVAGAGTVGYVAGSRHRA